MAKCAHGRGRILLLHSSCNLYINVMYYIDFSRLKRELSLSSSDSDEPSEKKHPVVKKPYLPIVVSSESDEEPISFSPIVCCTSTICL